MNYLNDAEKSTKSKEELAKLLNELEDAFYLAIIAIKAFRRKHNMKGRNNDV